MSKASYGWIDWFRLPAALMVIAIHTAPFSSSCPTLDVLVTYGLGRVAVPFFLMITGYFVLAPCAEGGFGDKKNYVRHLKKTLTLYGISILLYLPVMGYAGKLPGSMKDLAKILVFDGTFYHLWYFPAVLLGSGLVMGLLQKFSKETVFMAALVLYLAGLLGDSYYGVLERIPALSRIYTGIFQVSSYTRNGIFYAPVFLMLGILLYNKKYRCSVKICVWGLVFGISLLLLESFWTDHLSLQRHNSMYLALLPVMYFLYQLLLVEKEKAPAFLRNGTLLFYVLHPLVIILVRGMTGIMGLQELLIRNSFVHYAAVCLGTFGITAICLSAEGRVRAHVQKEQRMDRT